MLLTGPISPSTGWQRRAKSFFSFKNQNTGVVNKKQNQKPNACKMWVFLKFIYSMALKEK